MAIDIQKLFNEDVPAKLAANPDGAKAVGAKFQFVINGEGGGQWYIDVSDSGPKAEPGNPGTADCTMEISTDDFQKLIENPQANGMQLFFSGKLKISGNQMLAMKLSKIFTL